MYRSGLLTTCVAGEDDYWIKVLVALMFDVQD